MTRIDEDTVTRVVSRDGTGIAWWTSGEGPPLVLVHGATTDHTTWQQVLPYLEPHATVHAMDRRGRGASGDAPDYDAVREFEDVAAVIDAVAYASGSAVDVLGHSFGGCCAFGAAALTSNIRRLVLYEGWPPPDAATPLLPPGLEERVDALMAQGNREAALEAFYREGVGMSSEEIDGLKAIPGWWQARVAVAHTLTRESPRNTPAFDPQEAAKITVPTLLMIGGDSPGHLTAGHETVAAALPDVRTAVLDGQQHIAHRLVPEAFAEHVVAFLRAVP